MEDNSSHIDLYRSACAECHRRKQKVSRVLMQFPLIFFPSFFFIFYQPGPSPVTTLVVHAHTPPQCNREWPCNHCQKRKVADKCRFIQSNTASSPSDSLISASEKKRARSHENDPPAAPVYDSSDQSDDIGLEAMGYAAGPLFESLTLGTKVSKSLTSEYSLLTLHRKRNP